MAKRIITESDVFSAAAKGNQSLPYSSKECLVTPQAWDKAMEMGVSIIEEQLETDAPPRSSGQSLSYQEPRQEEAVISEVLASMRNRMPAEELPANLEQLVRGIVQSRLGPAEEGKAIESAVSCDRESGVDLQGVRLVKSSLLSEGAVGSVSVPGSVNIEENLRKSRCNDQQHLSAGTMQWEKASFNRTLEQEEICVVIEGELQVITQGQTLTAKPGDMLYLPMGAQVTYSADSKVRLACVNYVS